MTMQHVSMKFITFKIKNPFPVKHLSTTNSICHCTVLLCLTAIDDFTNWTVLSPTMQSSSAIGTSMYTRPFLYKPTHNQIHIMLVVVYIPPPKKTHKKHTPAYSILCMYNAPTVSAWILQHSTSHSQHYHYHFHQHDHQTVMHVKLKTNGCKHEEKNCLSHSNKNYYKDNGITGALCHQAPRSPKAFAL